MEILLDKLDIVKILEEITHSRTRRRVTRMLDWREFELLKEDKYAREKSEKDSNDPCQIFGSKTGSKF